MSESELEAAGCLDAVVSAQDEGLRRVERSWTLRAPSTRRAAAGRAYDALCAAGNRRCSRISGRVFTPLGK